MDKDVNKEQKVPKGMFEVEVDGVPYSVMFYRDDRVISRGTFCAIFRSDGLPDGVYSGINFPSIAVCHPNDNFNKNTGRKIALKRALEQRGFDREDRTKFWQAYFAARGKVN